MIHFNFTIEDADAENLMSLFQHRINSNNELIMTELCKKEDCDKSYIDILKKDIIYWTELKTKIIQSYR